MFANAEKKYESRTRWYAFLGIGLLVLAGVNLGVAWWCWQAWSAASPNQVCWVAIVTGLGASLAFGGLMGLINAYIAVRQRSWWVRWGGGMMKRLLLVLQIVTTLLIPAAVAVMVFGFKMPTP